MPNMTAYLVLFLWPLVGIVLFRTQPPERALVWTILGGYLFLPVRPVIDFPMIPAIDKGVIASLVALIGALLLRRGWAAPQAGAVPLSVPRGRLATVHSRFSHPSAEAEAVAPAVPAPAMTASRPSCWAAASDAGRATPGATST